MKIVIIGNHCAGLTAAETIRKTDNNSSITIISKEDVPPYSRCLINHILSGEKNLNDILFKSDNFYDINSIETMFGLEVTKILPDSREVLLNNNSRLAYDKLIIATGGSPSHTEIKGMNTNGVFELRTLENATEIKEYCKNVNTAVVYGGGLVGLKAALGLFELGKKVKIVVSSGSILSQNLGTEEAEFIEEYLSVQGIEIIKNTLIEEIRGDGKIEEVKTSNGELIKCEILIIGKGVKANIALVDGTGIKTEEGIIIDNHCRTSVPNIYAAGDVTQSKDSIRKRTWTNALWPLAAEEGRVAAENILGKDSVLRDRTSMNSLNVIGLSIISCGLTGIRDEIPGAEKVVFKDKKKWTLNKFVIMDNKLIGFVLIGNIANAGILTTLVRKELPIDEIKSRMLSGRFDFPSMLSIIRKNYQDLKDGN